MDNLREPSNLSYILSEYRTLTHEKKLDFIENSGLSSNILIQMMNIIASDKDMNESIVAAELGALVNLSRTGNDGVSKCGTISYEMKQLRYNDTKGSHRTSITFDRVSENNLKKFTDTRPHMIVTYVDEDIAYKLIEYMAEFDDRMLELYESKMKQISSKMQSGISFSFNDVKDSIINVMYVADDLKGYLFESSLVDYINELGYDLEHTQHIQRVRAREMILNENKEDILSLREISTPYRLIAEGLNEMYDTDMFNISNVSKYSRENLSSD